MKAYKLIRQLKDGSLSPLFINKKSRLPMGIWMNAEEYPTKGFAVRKGWHCLITPNAPHLSKNNRIWVEVEVDDFEYFERPESQGGKWILAQKMKINNIYILDSVLESMLNFWFEHYKSNGDSHYNDTQDWKIMEIYYAKIVERILQDINIELTDEEIEKLIERINNL